MDENRRLSDESPIPPRPRNRTRASGCDGSRSLATRMRSRSSIIWHRARGSSSCRLAATVDRRGSDCGWCARADCMPKLILSGQAQKPCRGGTALLHRCRPPAYRAQHHCVHFRSPTCRRRRCRRTDCVAACTSSGRASWYACMQCGLENAYICMCLRRRRKISSIGVVCIISSQAEATAERTLTPRRFASARL